MQTNVEIVKALLDINAVELRANKDNWFTWTSGIKSPIYCDNRLTMSTPSVRRLIAKAFAEEIKAKYPEAEVVVGTATAGIPHAAWVAELLDLPMLYVRSSKKGHGKTNQIEGTYKKGQKAVVIEDLISTGGSSILAAQALQEEGLEVLGVVAIFSYNLQKATDRFTEANLSFSTLTNYDVLIEMLTKEGKFSEEDQKTLLQWRDELSK